MEQFAQIRPKEAPWIRRKQAEIRRGTFQTPEQQMFTLDLNITTNGDLPVPPTAQRFQEGKGHIPSPPQVPDDPNTYYSPAHRQRQSSLGTYMARDRKAFERMQRHPQLHPDEQDYRANVHALFPEPGEFADEGVGI